MRERKTTHGMVGTPTYHCWEGIVSRCRLPSHPSYHRYGGRGIKICDRWLKFEGFLEDMGVKPDGLTIDRIDNEGDYEAGNCRWVGMDVQNNNRGDNVYIEAFGEKLTVAQWARRLGISSVALAYRIEHGWSPEEAVSIPPKPQGYRGPRKRHGG